MPNLRYVAYENEQLPVASSSATTATDNTGFRIGYTSVDIGTSDERYEIPDITEGCVVEYLRSYEEIERFRNEQIQEFEMSPRQERREQTERILSMTNEEEDIPMDEFNTTECLD